ncbi:MAG: hypothetical protein ABR926_15405 [Streptosporangiaceae bacterium]
MRARDVRCEPESTHRPVGSLAIDLALCGLAAAWMLWMFTLHPG